MKPTVMRIRKNIFWQWYKKIQAEQIEQHVDFQSKKNNQRLYSSFFKQNMLELGRLFEKNVVFLQR